MKKLLGEIHLGEILLKEFMRPMGITACRLAADIDVLPRCISELVNGTRPITADTALRLSMFFGMEQRFWLNLPGEYDTRILKAGKKRYTSAELNAQCDSTAPMPTDLQEWDDVPSVGSEAL